MKTIAIRVSDELHHDVKTFATRKGLTLQGYIVSIIEKDLKANGVYTPSLKNEVSKLIADLSKDEIAALVNEVKRHASQITEGRSDL